MSELESDIALEDLKDKTKHVGDLFEKGGWHDSLGVHGPFGTIIVNFLQLQYYAPHL